MDEKEKQQALEEEQARLQALKVTDFFDVTSESGGQTEVPAGLVVGAGPLSSPLTLIQVALSCYKVLHVTGFVRGAFFLFRSPFTARINM